MKKIFITAIVAIVVLASCKKSKEEIATIQAENTDVALAFFKKTKMTPADLNSLKSRFPAKEKDTVAYYKDRVTDIFNDAESSSYLRVFYTDSTRKTVASVYYFVGERNIIAQEYYENGQARCTFETDPSGARNGYAYCYDEKGEKKEQTFYKNDYEVKDSLKSFVKFFPPVLQK
jgi:antitoxin component YwqK of YwqJK toxin-antitoxin module